MQHIIDHVGITVSNTERSKTFYAAALAPLGIKLVMEFGRAAGFGREFKPELWFSDEKTSFQTAEHLKVITPVHVCFEAASRADVDAFYAAAIKAGGRDHGAPGLRPHYHASYYGAFVLDPDGHNVEAVFHG